MLPSSTVWRRSITSWSYCLGKIHYYLVLWSREDPLVFWSGEDSLLPGPLVTGRSIHCYLFLWSEEDPLLPGPLFWGISTATWSSGLGKNLCYLVLLPGEDPLLPGPLIW
jgi:hypothetical protein